MQRQHFDMIVKAIQADNVGRDHGYKISIRNGEVYVGEIGDLFETPDVIWVNQHNRKTYIALTAIATVSEYR